MTTKNQALATDAAPDAVVTDAAPDAASVSPETLAAAQRAADAAVLAGVAVMLKPKGVLKAELQAQQDAELEAAGDALAADTRKLAEGAENAAFAALVATAEGCGDALGGALAASKGKAWLKELAAQCGACVWVLQGRTAGDAEQAAADLRKLCGQYRIARESARTRVERYASIPALCMKKGSIVKSQLLSIKQMFERVLKGVGVTLVPETLKYGTCDVPADKTAEERAKAAVLKAAEKSLRGTIQALKELGPLAIGQICAELAQFELVRRCKVAEQQAAALGDVVRDLNRRAEKGDTVAMGALIGAVRQQREASEHFNAMRAELDKVA